jgi:hypothetical protein
MIMIVRSAAPDAGVVVGGVVVGVVVGVEP